GEAVFTVVPQGENRVVGKVQLPVARSGKVRVGQRVLVRLANYPDEEYGVLEGRVSSLSRVPTATGYTADIDFPKGLCTNYGIKLPVMPEATGSVEIVTQELTLLERLLLPLKRSMLEGFQN
ncbi:MAG: HlyD family efflux transporter periplasmic adaptor subunit, partial [bacterium]|nr:HlyD family efflux transporter periplasmic adaptor subunit [bacterium]